jgi:D-beta-D-heptose 7-phosphate kinase/D-beta-D-heptose 1-phosphate adenosyltransferase
MKTIFTNGCFDVIHIGHVKLLEYCHKLAHQSVSGGQGRVVVGLNSDSSIKRIKGDSRPINTEADRAYVLESMKYVDEVILFDEDTPYNLIKKLAPDTIVKGGDYTPEDVIGNDIAKVEIFTFISGYSSTSTLEKMAYGSD